MKQRHRTSRLAAGLLLLASCTATDSPTKPHGVEHRLIAVRAAAVAPADVEIGRFGVVGWLNDAGAAAGPVEVVVEPPPAGTEACSTRLGFASQAEQLVAANVAPGQVASTCFHEAGRFAYRVKRGDQTFTGTVTVRGEEQR